MRAGPPHGALLTTYVNDIAASSIQAQNGMAAGSIIVKENYTPDKTLAALTVMYKINGYNPAAGDWFWAEYSSAGAVEAAGKVDMCISCHGLVNDNEDLFTSNVTNSGVVPQPGTAVSFTDSIAQYESMNNILRGSPGSVKTAMMFGEFYPNPGAGLAAVVTPLTAFLAEATGTFVLVTMIFSLTEGCNLGRPDDALAPVFIGLTVTIIICILAPLTQAGLNPARDLSPRLFSMLAGWGKAALPDQNFGFLTIYCLAPILGAIPASIVFTRIIEPLMKKKGHGDGKPFRKGVENR